MVGKGFVRLLRQRQLHARFLLAAAFWIALLPFQFSGEWFFQTAIPKEKVPLSRPMAFRIVTYHARLNT